MGIATEVRGDDYLRQARDGAYIQMLERGRPIALYVRGISMYPYIKDNDFLTIEPLADADIRTGDVVMVKRNNADSESFFIHRVVRIKKTGKALFFYTKGDNAGLSLEGPFEVGQIKGSVAGISRNTVQINCHTPTHRLLAGIYAVLSLYTPAFLKIMSLLCNNLRERSFPYFSSRLSGKDPLMRNTQRLAVLALRDVMHDEHLKHTAVAIIAEGLRWNYFCSLAIESGRTFVTEKNIRLLEKAAHIPLFVLKRLKETNMQIIAETTRAHRRAAGLVKSFAEAHIDAIPLKGTFLSELLYSDTAGRGISNDMDILIREEDLAPSLKVLEKLGYTEAPEEEIEPWRWHKELVSVGYPPVDLHWDITMMKRSPERIAGIWQQAVKVGLADEGGEWAYYILSGETLLLYLCVNILHSKGYRNFKYYLDLDRLLFTAGSSFNWDLLIENAVSWKINNSVFAALWQTRKLLGCNIPPAVFFKLRPSLMKRLFTMFFLNPSVIFANTLRRRILDSFLSYILFELLEAGSLRDFVLIAKRVMFPPRRAIEMTAYAPRCGSITSRLQYWICILIRFRRGFCKIARSLKG